MPFRLPNNTERAVIMGHTGSGKTVLGAYLLSQANFHKQPWVILDIKGDDLLRKISRKIQIGTEDKLPKKPGIYYIDVDPLDKEGLELWLRRVRNRGNIGLFADEAYELPYQRRDTSAFKAILSQGRSLKIPVYCMTQRPVACNRSVFTEADFCASFGLTDILDQKRVSQFTPSLNPVWDWNRELPDYHARWYSVKDKYAAILTPCPEPDTILEMIDSRLRPKKRFL